MLIHDCQNDMKGVVFLTGESAYGLIQKMVCAGMTGSVDWSENVSVFRILDYMYVINLRNQSLIFK
jgi:hypothetical protein